jgi:DNA/RNA-binding domain of Phe-tRNA-synthetase-like protein
MDETVEFVAASIPFEGISALPNVAAARKAYRSCGKDPARYRLSSEALLRRVVQGKGLYKVNNIVDINNLISMKYHFTIGAFDRDAIAFPVQFRIGQAGEPYEGIGRGELNIENLPVLADALGPFGSPTSDSMRTRTHARMQQLLFCILSFGGASALEPALAETIELLERFADAKNIQVFNV